MERSDKQKETRERYVLALIEATYPLQKAAADREVCLELLIEAADSLKQHLVSELQEYREEEE